MIFALDLLGLGSHAWDVMPTIKVFPDGWGYGTFGPKVFGDALKKVKKLHASGKPSMFRLQLIYSKDHKFPSEKYLRQEIPRWDELGALFPNIKSFISPCCEYSEESRSKVYDMMSLATQLAPHSAIVQSPGRLPNGRISPTYTDWYVEEHGNRARTGANLVSCDGENAYDMCDEMKEQFGIEHWIERHRAGGCQYCFLWGARFNLIEAHNTLPPMARKAAPEVGYIKAVARLSEGKSALPLPIFPFTAPVKPYLLKTFAEDQQGPEDVRENRPMFMVPKREKPLAYVDIVTFDNQRVARFPRFKDKNPLRTTDRYYFSTKYGYQLADKAIAMSGSPFVYLDEKGKKTGPFHMAFRAPFFQVPK